MRLACANNTATIAIHNAGPPIDAAIIERIFEYGVSDSTAPAQRAHRGQGLFVAKTYMAKMGGTIAAENIEGGVRFTLSLPKALPS